MRMTSSLLAAALALTASAEVTIKIDRVQQRYPWNGIVDIDYTVAGMPADADFVSYLPVFAVSATTNGVPLTHVCEHFVGKAASMLESSNGTYRVAWDSAADGAAFATDDATVSVELRYSPFLTDGDYMIVDLSGVPYSVTYLNDADVPDPVATFNNDTFKTTKIVLKKVKKGCFWAREGGAAGPTVAVSGYVRMTNDFFMALFPTTRRQYELVTGKTPSSEPVAEGCSPDRCPVEHTYQNTLLAKNSNGFVYLMNQRSVCKGAPRAAFNLPSSIQFEYVQRAGTETAYSWGSTASDSVDYAWTSANANGVMHEVGTLQPNDWGFYDMFGSIWHWTRTKGGSVVLTGGTVENPLDEPGVDQVGDSVIDMGGPYSSGVQGAGRRDNSPAGTGGKYGFRLVYNCSEEAN